jgi:hypothetical protein
MTLYVAVSSHTFSREVQKMVVQVLRSSARTPIRGMAFISFTL